MLIKLPSIADEAEAISRQMGQAHQQGTAWQDMAIVYRTWCVGQACVDALAKARIPYQWQQRDRKRFSPSADAVTVLTMHASKGLEYPFVAVPGIGAMSLDDADLEQEARLFYIAATRATHRLLVTGSGDSLFMRKLFPEDSLHVAS